MGKARRDGTMGRERKGQERWKSERQRPSEVCVYIPYIPEIGPQLKRILKKSNINTTVSYAPKLKDILCSRNKTHLFPNKKKGMYKYTCTCSNKSTYVGQTTRNYQLRWNEHARAIQKKSWQHSGLTQHYKHCTHPFNMDNFKPIHNMQGKKKTQTGL